MPNVPWWGRGRRLVPKLAMLVERRVLLSRQGQLLLRHVQSRNGSPGPTEHLLVLHKAAAVLPLKGLCRHGPQQLVGARGGVSGVAARPHLAYLLEGVLLQLVRDALLRLVAPLCVEELALVPVGALLPVGAGLLVDQAPGSPEKLLERGPVASKRIVWRHEPEGRGAS